MRTLVRDAAVGEIVTIMGWVKSSAETGLWMADFSGDIFIITNNQYAYRSVIRATGMCVLHDDAVQLENTQIEMINQCSLDTIPAFYHEGIAGNKLKRLREYNILENEVRTFLFKNDFIETSNPLLWKSVKEYGMHEWVVKNPLTGEETYRLLQSPNILNLIMCISGIERCFQFAKCFRLSQENNFVRFDTLVEFTQLAITGAFIDNKQGQLLIEALMKRLVKKLYQFDLATPFETLDSGFLISRYNSDKPDLRYKHYYCPQIGIRDSITRYFLIPYTDIRRIVIQYISKFYTQSKQTPPHFVVGSLETILENDLENSEWIKQKFAALCLGDSHNFTWVAIDDVDARQADRLFRNMMRFLELYKKNTLPQFNFYWVTNYPFQLDVNSGVDGLSQNIFTKRNGSQSFAYDLVLNGFEIASGSEKVYDEVEFKETVKMLDLTVSDYSYFVQALHAGAPPLFSIGIGWERLVWKLLEETHIQNVMPFPFSQEGICDLW